ncbi:MAG: MBL fold metallo-hydrolase [Muribaculaceae bacterium]
MKLLMLGTGSAAVTHCFNTCFAIIADDGSPMLVDAGGGNGILRQLELATLRLEDIHDMFVTHTHTDHILGAVWIVRMVAQSIYGGKYTGTFTVRGHDEVIAALRTICFATLPVKVTCHIDKEILLQPVTDGETFSAIGCDFTAFDICSTKAKQYGFVMQMPSDAGVQRLVCLGDEPFNERCRHYAEGAKWLLSEAFCLYTQRERFKPYEKHHSTALDAGKLAESLKVSNLLLYHTEDKTLDTRREKYTAEAATHFSGNIVVPDDLEQIEL